MGKYHLDKYRHPKRLGFYTKVGAIKQNDDKRKENKSATRLWKKAEKNV